MKMKMKRDCRTKVVTRSIQKGIKIWRKKMKGERKINQWKLKRKSYERNLIWMFRSNRFNLDAHSIYEYLYTISNLTFNVRTLHPYSFQLRNGRKGVKMNIWQDEMKKIKKLKKTIYKPPLPLKKQRTAMRAQMPGKVKVFTDEEIFLFSVKRYRQSFV